MENEEAYMRFLDAAAANYKYCWRDQLSIYAQRPKATACADFRTWNRLGYWIKRGTHGIALIDDSSPRPFALRYVFDIADTDRRIGPDIQFWSIREDSTRAVTTGIKETFALDAEASGLPAALSHIAEIVVEERMKSCMGELRAVTDPNRDDEIQIKTFVIESVRYMLYRRCGLEPDNQKYFKIYFTGEIRYNQLKEISILGQAASSAAESVLREIEKAVKRFERDERSRQNGTQLQESGRLLHTGVGSTGGSEDRKVRDAETDTPAGEQGGTVHSHDDGRDAEYASGGDRPASERDDGADHGATDEGARRGRSAESRRSDEVGRADEQHPERGGGNRPDGTDLQLTEYTVQVSGLEQLSLFPSEEEQKIRIEQAEAEKASAFVIPQEDIDAVLALGGGLADSKYRIYMQYKKQASEAENAAFLKKEYGSGGSFPVLSDKDIGEWHDRKGIRIGYGTARDPKTSVLLSWKRTAKRIRELIAVGRYLNPAEQREYAAYVQEQLTPETGELTKAEPSSTIEMLFVDYSSIKLDHPDDIVLYQVGDFFEIYGEDAEVAAEILDLHLASRDFPGVGRVAVSGIPVHALEEHIERLRKECDVTIAAIDNESGQRKVYKMTSAVHSSELDADDAAQGNAHVQKKTLDVMIGAEESSNNAEPISTSERFTLIETENGYAVWDEIQNGIHVDSDGVPEEFTSEWQAQNYLKAVKEAVREKQAEQELESDTEPNSGLTNAPSTGEEKTELSSASDTEAERQPTEKTVDVYPAEATAPPVHSPEDSLIGRHNYHITDDTIGVGTSSERYANNLAAIRCLKQIEAEQRLATPEEQDILAQYVGWGGLADCFDERHSRYGELKAQLTESEYSAARESTLTAFYTPPVVVRAIYQALENIGFKTGNVLEPSCGTGNFLGMLPESMSGSRFYGVELDSISGRIAQQLYQNARIAVQGYEDTDFPDSFFDAAVGNVPFGQFKVSDRRYNKYNFLIHDYFFARTLDKVRPGGIIAFITSKGTMDKEDPSVRKYIAQRAELLGAIRLPNDIFRHAAGTKVTSDIIFLQKRDRIIDVEPDWIHLNRDANGLTMNAYFADHPEMILGEMREISGPYGPETACIAAEGTELADRLAEAIQNIHGEITDYELGDAEITEDLSILADPGVRNFSYTVADGKIYYRENSRMNPIEAAPKARDRIKAMIALRDCTRSLIEYQTEDYPYAVIRAEQQRLNGLYDAFRSEYGLINSRENKSAFQADNAYYLLCSLEVLDSEGGFVRKADMFTKRTIRPHAPVTRVDTASEALTVSLGEKACVNLDYMTELTGKSEEELTTELRGVVFRNPMYGYGNSDEAKYLPADEYLSGNVREKLRIAKKSAELYPEDYQANVEALEKVQPVDLTAAEISVRIGSTWVPPEIIEQFMYELFDTSPYARRNIRVYFSECTGEWNISKKSHDPGSVLANSTYGTKRVNGYKILEDTLNLRQVRIFDYKEDNGKKIAVLNEKETLIAQGKQEQIKAAFAEWIWADPQRRNRLCKLYNEKYNSIRPREYDGSCLKFVGMNPEIQLRTHQVNAVARILFGGNTLLAHVVGAGKTYTMVAAAMESKRLGLCTKSLIVVPNHLTGQWASEWMQLYPSANILVATEQDFETKNRRKICARIATGDYDAVIIGHSQLEKIPLSVERQRLFLEQQKDEIINGIQEIKRNNGDVFSIKQLERTRKSVNQKLDALNDPSNKDDVVTFEELGVDRLFIDEAHYYKNLAAFSKMRNVGGISQTEAKKSSDLYLKCRYMDELTDGHGTIFATGTPVSNSMVELYTMQKYLQYGMLREHSLLNFDAWASTFGETVTAMELAPEGTGYRMKTRFAKFHNLPELMAMFREAADVQTADMLKLPVPKANYHTIQLKPSEYQKEMVTALGERAERVRAKAVNSSVDNMLLITNDGRKLALDQRLLNDLLPDSETGKIAACADNVFDIWQRTAEQRSAQLIFCDLSTPQKGKFNIYDDLRDKLITKGIPEEEIAYIHSAKNEQQKQRLFAKVRAGQVRILMGSTQKMGAGTNVQDRLIALHHIDCPWRPSDLQQREGRIIRQGNTNPEVDIYTYVTEGTFDSYLYQLVESKQRFIGQIMTSKSPARSAEDIDETALSYAEIKALCAGDPRIKEKMDLELEVQRLNLLKSNHLSQKYALEDKIAREIPSEMQKTEQRIRGYQQDIERRTEYTRPNAEGFSPMIIDGVDYTEKKDAGTALLEARMHAIGSDAVHVGEYRGFDMAVSFDILYRVYRLLLRGVVQYTVEMGHDGNGNIQRIDNLLDSLEKRIVQGNEYIDNLRAEMERAQIEVQKPFPQETELQEKSARLGELNTLLDLDKPDNLTVADAREAPEQTKPVRKHGMEREL